MFKLMLKYGDNSANDIDLKDYPALVAGSGANSHDPTVRVTSAGSAPKGPLCFDGTGAGSGASIGSRRH
jgi:hypothetical protein